MRSCLFPVLLLALANAVLNAQEFKLPLDAADATWHEVDAVPDGRKGGAASFMKPGARIDAGPCPVNSGESFTLTCHLRTKAAGFATVLIARDGDAVGLSLVFGREPGRVSFEAWSWKDIRLISTTRVDDARWHSVLVSYDAPSNLAILAIDGRIEAARELGPGGSPGARLRLGNNIGTDQPFRGDLDEVQLTRTAAHPEWHRALAPVLDPGRAGRHLARWREALLSRERGLFGGKDQSHWKERRSLVRESVADALGLAPPPPREALYFQIHASRDAAGAVAHRVSWMSWPGHRATGWLWKQRDLDNAATGTPLRRPAVLCPHGHWEGGATHPVVQARCQRFAEAGYIVLAVDSEHVEDVASGVSSIGVMTWNNMRAFDHLLERPDVDPARIGVTGASGGAQQTMYLMALEDRIAVAAPICMITFFREILGDLDAHCGCNHPPRIGWLTDEPEMCAVFAPRPAFYGSVTGDWTAKFPKEGLPEMTAVYRKFDRTSEIAARHLEAGHNYDRPFRESVYEFFDRRLSPERTDHREPERRPLPQKELLAIAPVAQAPEAAVLAAEFKARRPRFRTLADAAPALPWRLRPRGFEVVRKPAAKAAFGAALSLAKSPEPGPAEVPIPMLFKEARTDTAWTLVVGDEGKGAIVLRAPPWLAAADRLALADLRFTGEWSAFARAWRRNGLLLGAGEGYVAADDLAHAVESLPGDAPVTVVALGATGVAALIAGGFQPRIAALIIADLGPTFAQAGNRAPSCPEILRHGDLPELIKALRGPRVVVLGGVPAGVVLAGGEGVEVTARREVLDDAAIGAALAGRLR